MNLFNTRSTLTRTLLAAVLAAVAGSATAQQTQLNPQAAWPFPSGRKP